MWRLAALILIGGALWAANKALPATNDEAQLRSLTDIAVSGAFAASAAFAEGSGANDGTAMPAPSAAEAPLDEPLLRDLDSAAQRGTGTAMPTTDVGTISAPGTASMDSRPDRKVVLASASKVETPQDVSELVTSLQRQLRRVGCFKGSADGHWDASTRRAMARFNERAGVQSQLDAPSPAFVTVVAKFGNRACGAPCPLGSAPNTTGICISLPQVEAAASTKAVLARTSAQAIRPQAKGASTLPAQSAPSINATSTLTKPHTSASTTVEAALLTLTGSSAWAPTVLVTQARPAILAKAVPAVAPVTAPLGTAPATRSNAVAGSAIAKLDIAGLETPQPLQLAKLKSTTASAAAPPKPRRTTIATASEPRKKLARKSSGWGGSQYGFSSDRARFRSRNGGGTWLDSFMSGLLMTSRN